VAHQFSRQDIEISLDLDPELPLFNMDEDKIKQVFVNLLVNAQQAMEKNGLILIGSRFLSDSNQIELRFLDNGKASPQISKRGSSTPFSARRTRVREPDSGCP
jgi:two-component system, NtrC family, sensor kinase